MTTASSHAPHVSVVIPTYLRPGLVLRAIRSALEQTIHEIEVIVVVDGRDAETSAAVDTIADSRVSVVVPELHLGQSGARNMAVGLARAPWVAFLDDDDEWLPRKLEVQLRTAKRSLLAYPIVACKLIARDEVSEVHWPSRHPRPGEPLSEYFFCPRLPFTGEGMVINSAIFTSRDVAMRVPFRGLIWDDPDWLLRATRIPGAGLEFAPEMEPLLVWHIERKRERITNRLFWRDSLDYARANRELFTARSFAGFVLHVVSSSAAAQGDIGAFPLLLREALSNGQPAPVDLLAHLGNFVLPDTVKRWSARLNARIIERRRENKGPAPVGGSE